MRYEINRNKKLALHKMHLISESGCCGRYFVDDFKQYFLFCTKTVTGEKGNTIISFCKKKRLRK